jgi:hypothetical protein
VVACWFVPVAVGETFERYEIESLIGRGGMGEVYRAVDTRLRRKVALKVLRSDRDNADAVARLFREARSAAVLTHPNTVAIHDVGESEGIFYIVMELVTGRSLLAYVGDERVPVARKLSWLVDTARALGAAHKAGVIHRDVKPSNVMVSDEGVVKVLDFGLAKPLAPVSFRTQVGHVLGTPRYMAPEHLAGAEIDARTDQYAYGLTAYELIAGKHPGGVLAGPVDVPLLDAIVPPVSRAVAQVIARAMANAPEDRFASMEELAVALEDAIAGRASRAALSDRATAGAREASEITEIEAPITEASVTDTVRFDDDVSREVSGEVSVAEPDATAATTKRAGGGGAAVVAQIDLLPAGLAAEPEKVPDREPQGEVEPADERDPEADRPTMTGRPAARQPPVAAPPAHMGTLIMADAPGPVPAKNGSLARPAARTLLSADSAATPAPLAKTLLAAGSVPPEVAAARDRAVSGADAKAKAKAKAKAPVADPKAPVASRAVVRQPAPKRSPAWIAAGITVLGLCAFGGAYVGSKQLARSDADATAGSISADAPATSASATGPTLTATTTGTLSIMPLGTAPGLHASASASAPSPSLTPVPTMRRPPRPIAAPPATPPPLDTKIR